jgi:hypothetical protein
MEQTGINENKNELKTGYIYSIRSHQCENIYIGSTFNNLNKRFYQHKQQYKLFIKGIITTKCSRSRDIIKYNDSYIELIKEVHVKNRFELNKYEGEEQRKNKNILVNRCLSNPTIEEKRQQQKKYRDNNKEKIKIYKSENKEKINQYNKQYHSENKEKINTNNKKYYEENKQKMGTHMKKYYEENKEKINTNNKKYYEENKQKIKQRHQQKIKCEICNCETGKYNFNKHSKTKKHMKNKEKLLLNKTIENT